MLISVSYLGITKNKKENIKKLSQINLDFFHLDVMDGKFVPNKTENIENLIEYFKDIDTNKDVHLMVEDVKTYIDKYKIFKPKYITFHFEAVKNHLEIISYIKSLNIKAGISIKPNTSIEEIKYLLPFVDLVLIMSVEPGKGGQTFIEMTTKKINTLLEMRRENDFLIEVDGGINNETIKKCKGIDIAVVGNYITSSDNYMEKIDNVRYGK